MMPAQESQSDAIMGLEMDQNRHNSLFLFILQFLIPLVINAYLLENKEVM